MKKSFILSALLCIAFMLQAQDQYERVKRYITRAGSLELFAVSKPVENITPKISDYDSLNMSFTGNWGFGQSFSVSCSHTGDTVFVGAGAGVIIFDATDPYNPVKLSEIHARALVDASCYDPVNHIVYLAAYFSGLEVWDVTDIIHPVRMSRSNVDGLPRSGIYEKFFLEYNYCLLATVANGLKVFNVTDPFNPVNFGGYSYNQLCWSSAISQDNLFLGFETSGCQILDISLLPLVGQYGFIPSFTSGIFGDEYLAYIVASNYGLKIYEWQEQPIVLAGQLAISGFPYRIVVFDDHAYIANSTTNPGGGINVIDVSNASLPQHIADYPGFQTYIAGKDDAVYATGGQEGCLFLDVSVPATPVEASTYLLPSSTWDVSVSGNYAYSGSNGFRVFDVSDKNHPIQVGYDETQGDIVEVSGNLAVFCLKSMGSNNKVNIMDISDPSNPEYIAHYLAPVMTYDLDLKDNYAFVACWWDGFRVVDFSNPENPVLAAHEMGWVNGGIPGEEWCYVQALDVEGNYLYLIDYGPFQEDDTKGVYVFDITNPVEPVYLSRYENYTGTGYDIHVSNGFAYTANSEGGFGVISVGDPLNVSEVAYLPLNDAAWAVDVFENYAFVANYINEGVQVINIANPTAPFIEGYYKRSGCFAVNVTFNSGHVFVSDGPAGFDIYKFDLLSGTKDNCIAGKFDLMIQPNPAKDKISVSVQMDIPQNIVIELYNMEGRKIKSLYNNNEDAGPFTKSFNISGLPKGVYLLKFNMDQQIITRKFVSL